MPSKGVVAVVLAAGRGRRFAVPGEPVPAGGKLHHPLLGRPLCAWVLAALGEVPRRFLAGTAVVCDGAHRAEMEEVIRRWGPPGTAVLASPDPEEGMAASLREAARHAETFGAAGLLVCLGDMPLVDGTVLVRLLRAFRPPGIVVARGERGPTPPTVFPWADLPALLRLRGDTGAREVLRRAAGRVREVPIAGNWWLDVDSAEDLVRASELLRERTSRATGETTPGPRRTRGRAR